VAYQQDSGMVANDPVMKRFDLRLEIRTSRTTRRNYDFEKPRLTLESENRGDALPDLEDYDYSGRFIDRERGKHLAKRALERYRGDFQLAGGKSDHSTVRPGAIHATRAVKTCAALRPVKNHLKIALLREFGVWGLGFGVTKLFRSA